MKEQTTINCNTPCYTQVYGIIRKRCKIRSKWIGQIGKRSENKRLHIYREPVAHTCIENHIDLSVISFQFQIYCKRVCCVCLLFHIWHFAHELYRHASRIISMRSICAYSCCSHTSRSFCCFFFNSFSLLTVSISPWCYFRLSVLLIFFYSF